MGEAAPGHAAARPAAFPLLGAGMVGPGPPGGSSRTAAAAAAVPPLHSAIVERLRARIELCRRHHSTCERRYERGRAESSERERESTLQLLSLVQQGGTARRGKSGRALDQSRGNNEHKGQSAGEAESKASTRIALQGTLRRKIEGQPPGYIAKQNGLSCVGTGAAPDFKRLRMETGSLRPGHCAMISGQSPSIAGSVALSHTLRRKDPFMMPHDVGSDLFNMTLREMKKEPIDVQPCSQSTDPMMVFDFKEEGGGQIDPELQDLFDELTKSVPPLNDLELEKMLKQDDDFGLDLGRPSSAGAAHPCPHLDKPIKTRYSPDYGQASGSSPQLRPASAGPSFTALSTSPIGQMTHTHVSSGTTSRGLPSWPEMSHAEQLKQMAANQQQPNSLLHHQQQQSQTGGVRNWSSGIGGHPNSSCFGQEPVAGSGSLSQPRISPQSAGQNKGMPNCLFKPGGYNPTNPTDMKVLSSKPMLHFTPKTASSTTSQQMPHMTGSQSKLTTQQQSSTGGQRMQFQLSSSCLQPKLLSQRPPLNQHGLGINLKMTQRQALAPGPRLSANGCLAGIGQPQQQRSPAPNTQQKNTGKSQRQLSQIPHHTNDTEKFNTQDQFNRHLTRPPPDYKQPQGVAGVQHPTLYPGLASSPLTNNGSDQTDIPSLSRHLPNGQGAKMVPNSGDRRFHTRSDPVEVQTCANQLHQQANKQVQIGMHQNKPQFQGANTQVVSFPSGVVPTTQHVRTSSAGQDTILGQGLGGMTTTTSRETGLSWVSAPKQNGGLQGLDVKRQTDGHFPPRPIGPPNQVAPHSGLIPLNPAVRGSAPRPTQPHITPLPGVSSLNQSSPEQQGCMSTFISTAQSPGTYQNSRAGRLTFDFLQDGDNTVPGINADSDFIDSLLKSGSGNDDWMKDINLEEILGGHS
ncbi:mastermind-like protein 2 [Pygocentrus nattereri]|uniref:Neurogenic mastermind-like N-terminal domain-containing protein n=1 Tax=Pygocentrus nattereri TaxID=42514 RepID=A0AAR2LY33_PYGNA|nr:mastermind-like protein 2 [Pygocentrus nattereri]